MRIFMTSLLAGGLAASAGSAGTVAASYDAFASISVSIVSATYQSTGADARGALTNGVWQDALDSGSYKTGTGSITAAFDGPLFVQDVDRYSVTKGAQGFAGTEAPSGTSGIAGWIAPTFNYNHACAATSMAACAGVDRIELALAYNVETRATTTVFDAITGMASAEAQAFLRMDYFSMDLPWSDAGKDFALEADDTSAYSGIHNLVMDPGSVLGLDLYAVNVTGSASYAGSTAPLIATPLPSSIPLVVSGMVLMGLVSRRRPRGA